MTMATSSLKTCTNTNTQKFTFKCDRRECKVVDVYDGDTCTLAFELDGFGYTKVSCRLYGIDTCEMKGGTEDTKIHAVKAKNRLIQMVLDHRINLDENFTKQELSKIVESSTEIVLVEFKEADKYGRPLVLIYTQDNTNVNETLIKEGYAQEYHGGKKTDWVL